MFDLKGLEAESFTIDPSKTNVKKTGFVLNSHINLAANILHPLYSGLKSI